MILSALSTLLFGLTAYTTVVVVLALLEHAAR